MTWGKYQKGLAKVGVTKKAPVLGGPLPYFFAAFQALHSGRQISSAGAQPLLHSEITSYLNAEGGWLPRHLRPKFYRLMRALDSEFLTLSQTGK